MNLAPSRTNGVKDLAALRRGVRPEHCDMINCVVNHGQAGGCPVYAERDRRRRRDRRDTCRPSKLHGPVFRPVRSGRRSYRPELGRWDSRDPIGEEGGRNVAAYLRNDGINGVDLLGQFSLKFIGEGARWCPGIEYLFFGVSFDFDAEDYRKLGGLAGDRRIKFISLFVSSAIHHEIEPQGEKRKQQDSTKQFFVRLRMNPGGVILDGRDAEPVSPDGFGTTDEWGFMAGWSGVALKLYNAMEPPSTVKGCRTSGKYSVKITYKAVAYREGDDSGFAAPTVGGRDFMHPESEKGHNPWLNSDKPLGAMADRPAVAGAAGMEFGWDVSGKPTFSFTGGMVPGGRHPLRDQPCDGEVFLK